MWAIALAHSLPKSFRHCSFSLTLQPTSLTITALHSLNT